MMGVTEGNTEKRIYTVLFIILSCISVLPVWWFSYFLTADGPCHVYNASVLKSMWWGDGSFYSQFYYLNTELEPNWFSHAALAFLMLFVGVLTAEKILITACVLGWAFGFRYLVKGLSPNSSYASLYIFPFLWQMVMFMGFYNYMLSIAAMFFICGYWMRYHMDMPVKRMVLVSAACVVMYFMHLLGVFLAVAVMGLISLSSLQKNGWKQVVGQLSKIVVIMLPACLLILSYILHNTSSFNNEYRSTPVELWNNLRDIFSLQSIHPGEYKLSTILAQVIALLFVYAIVRLVWLYRRNVSWLMPVIMFVLLMLCYFFAYESMLGGSYIRPRLECLVYVFAILSIATVPAATWLRISTVFVFVAFTTVYMVCRWQAFGHINTLAGEFASLDKYLAPRSVVLPLKYVHFPTDDRGTQVLANKVLLFSHVGERVFIGSKQLIFMENYEANTEYFPLLWKESVNPFKKLAVGSGIEAVPPQADIVKYNREVQPVNYIVVWGRQGEILSDSATKSMADTINKYYEFVHSTTLYKIELYKLKGI